MSSRSIFLLAICLTLVTYIVGHKIPTRKLSLQVANLNQRFDSEKQIMKNELTTMKEDIVDLKTDSFSIIEMFKLFTAVVKEVKDEYHNEKLKFKSLEMDFKQLRHEFDELESRSKMCCKGEMTEHEDVNIYLNTSYSDPKHYGQSYPELTDLSRVSRSGSSGGYNATILVAKYGDNQACFLNLTTKTLNRCVTNFGSSVRAIAVDNKAKRFYWADYSQNNVMSSAFNGSDVAIVGVDVTTLGLAVGHNQDLFYTNVSGNIFRKTITDDKYGVVWNNVGDKPRRIYIDQDSRAMYAITNQWTGIVKINYLTNEREMMVQDMGRIKALTVDETNQILYFSVNTTLYLKDLLGTETFAIWHGSGIPSDLVVHGDYMYIVYYYSVKIDVMDLRTRRIVHTVYGAWTGAGNTVSMVLVSGM